MVVGTSMLKPSRSTPFSCNRGSLLMRSTWQATRSETSTPGTVAGQASMPADGSASHCRTRRWSSRPPHPTPARRHGGPAAGDATKLPTARHDYADGAGDPTRPPRPGHSNRSDATTLRAIKAPRLPHSRPNDGVSHIPLQSQSRAGRQTAANMTTWDDGSPIASPRCQCDNAAPQRRL